LAQAVCRLKLERLGLASQDETHEIYLEVGQKKTFAIAVDWPGWCRFGKDEQSAVRTLLDATPRYSKVAKYANLEFSIPESISLINTVARLEGNSTTDFGAPDIQLPNDWDPVEEDELERYVKLLKACWLEFDKAVEKTNGKELLNGPRGGGRDLARIIVHVVEAEEVYLYRLGWKLHSTEMKTIDERKDRVRSEVIRGLRAITSDDQLPREGPRGGKRWSPRFFVRRLAWHAVDHAWEIEDRII
jgi:hypothetical protein